MHGHQEFSHLSGKELSEFASSPAKRRELETKFDTGQSTSTGTWIDTLKRPMSLGCAHATEASPDSIHLPAGQIVPQGKPTYYADQNPFRRGDRIQPKWELEIAESPLGPVTDPVNDLAMFQPTNSEPLPATIPLAPEIDILVWLGKRIDRIGRYGRIISGIRQHPQGIVTRIDSDDLPQRKKAVVSKGPIKGDSGGPMLMNGKYLH